MVESGNFYNGRFLSTIPQLQKEIHKTTTVFFHHPCLEYHHPCAENLSGSNFKPYSPTELASDLHLVKLGGLSNHSGKRGKSPYFITTPTCNLKKYLEIT